MIIYDEIVISLCGVVFKKTLFAIQQLRPTITISGFVVE
jgi:hypothetical protein